MKSIKEKAEEYARCIANSKYTREDFVSGANYVLDILEQALTPQKCLTDAGIDICPMALVKTALQIIEELKK